MFCDRCGAQMANSAAFCSGCGRNLKVLVRAPNRIQGHARLLGILWLAYGAFHISPGLAMFAFFRGSFLPHSAPATIFQLFPWIGGLLMATGFLALVIGIGLLLRQTWARLAAIIFGAINLTSLPFGTALGIYTLWVLLSDEHEREYRTWANAA